MIAALTVAAISAAAMILVTDHPAECRGYPIIVDTRLAKHVTVSGAECHGDHGCICWIDPPPRRHHHHPLTIDRLLQERRP